MSLTFKKDDKEEKSIERYDTKGHGRTITFVQPDGKCQRLNYSYMMMEELSADAEMIELIFSSAHVTLKGKNLATLFNDIGDGVVKKITVGDARYESLNQPDEPLVLEITVVRKE